jgi:hypothetical protein
VWRTTRLTLSERTWLWLSPSTPGTPLPPRTCCIRSGAFRKKLRSFLRRFDKATHETDFPKRERIAHFAQIDIDLFVALSALPKSKVVKPRGKRRAMPFIYSPDGAYPWRASSVPPLRRSYSLRAKRAEPMRHRGSTPISLTSRPPASSRGRFRIPLNLSVKLSGYLLAFSWIQSPWCSIISMLSVPRSFI